MYNKVLVFILSCLYLGHQMKYLSGNVNQTFTIANTKNAFIHNFDPVTSIYPWKTISLSQYTRYVNILNVSCLESSKWAHLR